MQDADITNILKGTRDVPAKQPIIAYRDFTEFINKNGLTANQATGILFSLMVRTEDTLKVKIVWEGGKTGTYTVTYKLADGKNVTTALEDAYNPNAKDDVFTADYHAFMQKALNAAPKQLVELTSAEQVKPMRERNYESYFKMAKAELPVGRIMQYIQYIATLVEKLIKYNAVQQDAKEVKWVQYHTSAASTQQLVRRFLNEAGELFTVDPATDKIVKAAEDHPWDMELINAIPVNVVQLTYVWLDVCGTLPDKWYQGIKAMQTLSNFKNARLRAAFKKFIAKKANIESVDELADENAIKAFINEKI